MVHFILIFVLQLPHKFKIEEGFVKYKVNAKAFFGAVTHPIEARNDSVKGEFYVKDGKLEGQLVIKSKFFVSGNTRRDEDVSHILGTDKYPLIIFKPLDIDTNFIKRILNNEKGGLKIKGSLTVRDITKIYIFDLSYEKFNKEEYFLKAEVKVKFTDFDINPPQIKGLGVIGKAITYAPDEIFLSGIIKIRILE